MDFYILLILAIGLSVDSFVISIGVGCQKGTLLWRGLRYALIMGTMHFFMLWLGWAVGVRFEKYIESFDHWVAFGLLAFIGGRMIVQAFGANRQLKKVRPNSLAIWGGIIVAIAASVDAFLAGGALSLEGINLGTVVPAFLASGMAKIGITQGYLLAFAFIGIVVFVISFLGLIIGKGVGLFLGKWAGVLGGSVLVLLGLWILLTHLNVIN